MQRLEEFPWLRKLPQLEAVSFIHNDSFLQEKLVQRLEEFPWLRKLPQLEAVSCCVHNFSFL